MPPCPLSISTAWGVVFCDLRSLEGADLRAVDALARLHLAARRGGCELRASGACPELLGLWMWVGLDPMCAQPRPPHAAGS